MNRTELKNQIDNELKTLKANKIEKDTLNWYLLNHLEKIMEHLEQKNNSEQLTKVAKDFVLFCTDCMNWDTDEYKTFTKLGEKIVKVSKNEHTKGGFKL